MKRADQEVHNLQADVEAKNEELESIRLLWHLLLIIIPESMRSTFNNLFLIYKQQMTIYTSDKFVGYFTLLWLHFISALICL